MQFLIYSIMVAGGVAALSEIWGEAAGAGQPNAWLNCFDRGFGSGPDCTTTLSTPVSGAITFDALTFHYPQRPNAVALTMSLLRWQGKPWRLLAPGAGKSTIMQMLLRFYDPEVGASQ